MPRIVIHDESGPIEVRLENESMWLCRCGLSSNKLFCDGSHKRTVDGRPEKLYRYEGSE